MDVIAKTIIAPIKTVLRLQIENSGNQNIMATRGTKTNTSRIIIYFSQYVDFNEPLKSPIEHPIMNDIGAITYRNGSRDESVFPPSNLMRGIRGKARKIPRNCSIPGGPTFSDGSEPYLRAMAINAKYTIPTNKPIIPPFSKDFIIL